MDAGPTHQWTLAKTIFGGTSTLKQTRTPERAQILRRMDILAIAKWYIEQRKIF